MSVEIDKPKISADALRKEWQEKHDPNLENLPGMRAFIEERLGGPADHDQSVPMPISKTGKFNNFQ